MERYMIYVATSRTVPKIGITIYIVNIAITVAITVAITITVVIVIVLAIVIIVVRTCSVYLAKTN